MKKIKRTNLPNFLTIARIICVPIVLVLLIVSQLSTSQYANLTAGTWSNNVFWLVGSIVFILAAATDWLDGYLARRWKVISNFGKLFDPIADKALVNGVIIVLMVYPQPNTFPIWAGLLLILRDIIVDGTRMYLANKGKVIAASWFGKLKTMFQFIGIPLLLFCAPYWMNWSINAYQSYLILLPIYFAVLFSLLSGSFYLKTAIKHLTNLKQDKKGNNQNEIKN